MTTLLGEKGELSLSRGAMMVSKTHTTSPNEWVPTLARSATLLLLAGSGGEAESLNWGLILHDRAPPLAPLCARVRCSLGARLHSN